MCVKAAFFLVCYDQLEHVPTFYRQVIGSKRTVLLKQEAERVCVCVVNPRLRRQASDSEPDALLLLLLLSKHIQTHTDTQIERHVEIGQAFSWSVCVVSLQKKQWKQL